MKFTVNVETLLDRIVEGDITWRKIIDGFSNSFKQDVERAEERMEKTEIKSESAGEDCEIYDSPMVIGMGRYGKFTACLDFPDCHNTKAVVKSIGVKCPKCNDSDVVEGKPKKNRVFYGYSKYFECDFTSWDKPIGRNCPKCNRCLIEDRKDKTI